ncbi:RNA polymerase sigma factor [Vagococcus sp.]|uniref:RNA polymerase sigma factor n=1 Tax=Vagococcus sp. TaxID=1933889 RepID=UPI003F9CB5FA
MRLNRYEETLIQLSQELAYYLIKTGASKEDAQDIVQDTFVKMLEADLILPYKETRAWMYRVTLRTYIDRYRRKKRYQELLDLNFKETQVWEFPEEKRTDLYSALQQLNVEEASLLIMKYEQDLSIKDIATILNASESKIKTALFRARKKIKNTLERGL